DAEQCPGEDSTGDDERDVGPAGLIDAFPHRPRLGACELWVLGWLLVRRVGVLGLAVTGYAFPVTGDLVDSREPESPISGRQLERVDGQRQGERATGRQVDGVAGTAT